MFGQQRRILYRIRNQKGDHQERRETRQDSGNNGSYPQVIEFCCFVVTTISGDAEVVEHDGAEAAWGVEGEELILVLVLEREAVACCEKIKISRLPQVVATCQQRKHGQITTLLAHACPKL